MSHTMSETYGEKNFDGKIVQAPVQDQQVGDDRESHETGIVKQAYLINVKANLFILI